MRLRPGLFLAVLLVLFFSGIAHGQTQPECSPVDAETKSRVVHAIARMLRIEPLLPVIDQERFVPGTCYWQFSLSIPNSDRHWVLYLSPDRRFLSATLWDVSADPEEADRQMAAQLRQQAEADQAPTRGPDAAPVTVVVFTDFQCSHCARFNEMVERYRKENPNKIGLIFRNVPLPGHDWAPPAARAGICISQQSPTAFWQFHDLLFSRQASVTAQNLTAVINDFIASVPGLRSDQYSQCISTSYPQARLELDLSEARSLDIRATPTTFINGRRYGNFHDVAAFTAAINLATPADPHKTGQ